MMQDNYDVRGTEGASVEELFLSQEESFSEAQARAIEENKSFAKTEFFRFDRLGTYRLRVLPIAPSRTDTVERRGYEYPVRQLLMELQRPRRRGEDAEHVCHRTPCHGGRLYARSHRHLPSSGLRGRPHSR